MDFRSMKSRSVKDELARICIEEYSTDSTSTLSMAFMDEMANNDSNLITSAAVAAFSTQPKSLLPTQNNLLTAYSGGISKKIIKVQYLLQCPDEEFDVHLNVTRRTIQKIYEALVLKFESNIQYNDFLMLIWYLSSESRSPSEVAQVFDIENEQDVIPRLAEMALKVRWLQGSSKMEFPINEYDEEGIVECFKRRSDLPNVLGAMGVIKLECLDGTWVNVLAIVDHERYFRHVELSNANHDVHHVIRKSSIYDIFPYIHGRVQGMEIFDKLRAFQRVENDFHGLETLLRDHPKNYSFYCPAIGYPCLPQLTPGLRDEEVLDDMTSFNIQHNDVVEYVRTALKEAVSRFPKLNSLETASHNIIFAAFILHNLCNHLRDTSIYHYDCSDQFKGF